MRCKYHDVYAGTVSPPHAIRWLSADGPRSEAMSVPAAPAREHTEENMENMNCEPSMVPERNCFFCDRRRPNRACTYGSREWPPRRGSKNLEP